MSKLVTFQVDLYPYCKGDSVELDAAELKRVDAVAAARKLESKPYVAGEVAVGGKSLEEQEVDRVAAAKAQAEEDRKAQEAENAAEVAKAKAAAAGAEADNEVELADLDHDQLVELAGQVGVDPEAHADDDALRAAIEAVEAEAVAKAEADAKAEAEKAKAARPSRRNQPKK